MGRNLPCCSGAAGTALPGVLPTPWLQAPTAKAELPAHHYPAAASGIVPVDIVPAQTLWQSSPAVCPVAPSRAPCPWSYLSYSRESHKCPSACKKEETECPLPNTTLTMLNFVARFRFIVKFGLVFNTWGGKMEGIVARLLNMKKNDYFPICVFRKLIWPLLLSLLPM